MATPVACGSEGDVLDISGALRQKTTKSMVKHLIFLRKFVVFRRNDSSRGINLLLTSSAIKGHRRYTYYRFSTHATSFLSASSLFYKRSCPLVGRLVGRSNGRSVTQTFDSDISKRLILRYFFIPITFHAPPNSYSFIHSFIHSLIHPFIHSYIHSFMKNVHSQNLNQARHTYWPSLGLVLHVT